ncbi:MULTISPECIES: DUF4835 family protein [Flavobacterium]|uniref:type IX secretion system protein PorD n=1 Tax=Flavobacterium TaxID=237 RepID=UPI000869038F|nr:MULTISPECIES: DUF4835 family protein [Flavobacterium]MBN9282971.1 DUF4835 family protein [Flavobacterium sp.]ODS83482.1 MAG: DUF4835 domain-containing protein [Chryseobacterium sp. SCN 40-13]OJV67605.1 MAG: DUF4835 domain-containing protein [Flavobacterium sp. 40-81]
MRNWILLLLTFLSINSFAQELNCSVNVNYSQITNVNPQIFKTLEKSVTEFMNNTKWTTKTFKNNEKINCVVFITVNSFESNNFDATVQVQSSRPIYNSTYSSPVLNFNDKDFKFRYVEFENMYFNPNSFDSNLISVLAFYANIIIGLDGDTYQNLGGTKYLEVASAIANVAQSSGFDGWIQSEKRNNRYYLINDMLSNTYTPFREAMYQYHFQGMDRMAENLKTAKEKIASSIETLSKVHDVRPNAFLTRVFFDAKVDEIVSVYSGGPNVDIVPLVDRLNRISPLNSSKWSNIKY